MIRPPPWARIKGNTARATRMYPRSFRLQSSAHCASGIVRKSPPRIAPALLTRMAILPKRRWTSRAARSTSSSRLRSPATMNGSARVSRAISAAAVSSVALSRAHSATRAPSAASPRAMARPMPRLAPVTSAIFSLSSRSIAGLLSAPPRLRLPRARKRRHVRLFEIGEPIERAGHRAREGLEVEPERLSVQPTTPLAQERLGAADVPVRYVLVTDRDLDQPLKRFFRLAARPRPVRLEQLVDFKVEPRGMECRCRVEGRDERRLRPRPRHCGQRLARTPGSRAERLCVPRLVGAEPVRGERTGVGAGQGRELATRPGVGERREDQRREPVARPEG